MTYDVFTPGKPKPNAAPNRTFVPRKPEPPVPGAKPIDLHAPWLRESGNASDHLRPAPKSTSATALALRKIATTTPRAFSRLVTDSINERSAVRGVRFAQ